MMPGISVYKCLCMSMSCRAYVALETAYSKVLTVFDQDCIRLALTSEIMFLLCSFSSECLDYKSFHGPKWRMEPSDLMVPVGLPEEEATLTCDAKGLPSPQYRYRTVSSFFLLPSSSSCWYRYMRHSGFAEWCMLHV